MRKTKRQRVAVEGFEAERPDLSHVHRDRGDMPLVIQKNIRRNPFAGFGATDIIHGHLPRNIEEAEKVAKKRVLYDPYSMESMEALYHQSRKAGRGDIGFHGLQL
jgi:hypothetical protein